jgi:hypothetical protein
MNARMGALDRTDIPPRQPSGAQANVIYKQPLAVM